MIIVQLSDPHLAHAVDVPYAGEAALISAVEHVRRLPARPDVVIVTGDIADHGRADEYARARQVLSALGVPVYTVPGNHDVRAELVGAFGQQGGQALNGHVQYVVDDGPVRLVALDTLVEGAAGGVLDHAQFDWLDARLSEAPHRPTLLFMHHPPFPVGVRALDDTGLASPDAFGQLIARHSQVEGIAAGHVHTPVFRRFFGTLAWTGGSTKHHLFPDLARGVGWAARSEAPSCLIHAWAPHIGLVTHVSRIGEDAPVEVLHDGERWSS